MTSDTNNAAVLLGGVVGLIIWILVIAWTAAIARRKARSGFGWGLLAFFFGFIALIVVALMPSRRLY